MYGVDFVKQLTPLIGNVAHALFQNVTTDRVERVGYGGQRNSTEQTACIISITKPENLVVQASEIKNMTVDEMNEKLAGLKEELFALRFQLAVNQLENTARLKAVKKDIARIKTNLRAAELEKQ